MAYIEINDCSKVIKKTTILDHIDLKLEKNRIYGFVGRNGSGKTMLFKILTGLAQPSSGEIRINGQRVSPQSGYPAKLGVMIENNGLWPYLTAFENLSALAAIRRELSDEEIAAVIERVGLSNDGKKALYFTNLINTEESDLESHPIASLYGTMHIIDLETGKSTEIAKQVMANAVLSIMADENMDNIYFMTLDGERLSLCQYISGEVAVLDNGVMNMLIPTM